MTRLTESEEAMEAERESQVFSKCPECGHDADDHAGGHGDDFDACLRTGCSCRGPFMESDLTATVSDGATFKRPESMTTVAPTNRWQEYIVKLEAAHQADRALIEGLRGDLAEAQENVKLLDLQCDIMGAEIRRYREALERIAQRSRPPTGNHCALIYKMATEALSEPAVEASSDIPACTGIAASWCPNCGSCTCARNEDGTNAEADPGDTMCPLHAFDSKHADSPATEAVEASDRVDSEYVEYVPTDHWGSVPDSPAEGDEP